MPYDESYKFDRAYHLDELADIINQTECEVITAPYPDEQVLLDWCKVYKVELLEEKQLESSDERLLAFWHFLLSADDKYIWGEFDNGSC